MGETITRRGFIRRSSLAISGALMLPDFLNASENCVIPNHSDRILILLHLAGGNDGLNTVIPYRNDHYYRARPTLAIPPEKVIKLTDHAGLHPALRSFRELYDNGYLTLLNNVGYPNPERSHVRSLTTWHTGSIDGEHITTGWIGRYIDTYFPMDQQIMAIEASGSVGHVRCGAFRRASDSQSIQPLRGSTSCRNQDLCFTEQLHRMSAGIKSGAATKVYHATLSGFDTHVCQAGLHAQLLDTYSKAVNRLVKDLKASGDFDRALIMTYSEFGRRVQENDHGGTDHGAANTLFLAGGKLRTNGCYNPVADLAQLEQGGPAHTIDFRQVYITILRHWLGVNPSILVSGNFEPLAFV